MSIPLEFTKARAEHLIACLSGGKPIAPEGGGGWTGRDMLFVAGACFFGALSQGPEGWEESDEETFMNNLFGTLYVYSEFMEMVADKMFENEYGDSILAMVTQPEFELPPANVKIIRHGAETKH